VILVHGSRMLTDRSVRRAVRFGFAHVCREGNVAEAKRYGEVYKLDLTDMRHQSCYAFYLACMAGHLDMAQWLAKTLKMTYSDATKHDNFIFRRACGHGYLQLAQWLVAHFGMESPKLRTGGNEAFNMACVNGHSHVVTWLVKIAELDPVRDRFDVIIENCYLANQEAMAVWLQSLLFSRRNA